MTTIYSVSATSVVIKFYLKIIYVYFNISRLFPFPTFDYSSAFTYRITSYICPKSVL